LNPKVDDLKQKNSMADRRIQRMLLGILLFQLVPLTGRAWGNVGHQIINRAAVESLPQPLRAWFEARLEFLVMHASDPDLLAHNDPTERPHHYTDADAYDRLPFARLREQFVQRHWPPSEVEAKNGTALWEIDSYTRNLESDFRHAQWDRANHDAVFLGHYAADITQPLHTVKNFDGQLTGQNGVHSRFETELVNVLAGGWHLQGAPAAEIPNLDRRIFEEYIESYAMASLVLTADHKAVSGRTYLDPAYFSRFFKLAGPLAERRLEDAASFVGSLWYTAWLKAGSPDLRGWKVPRMDAEHEAYSSSQ
jgi:hypothetical protein